MILDITDQELDVIMRSLMQQPWVAVNPVITKLLKTAQPHAVTEIQAAGPPQGELPLKAVK